MRFENPHQAFTYYMHGYESVVGPVKGVYDKPESANPKARDHTLLVKERPPFVTILTLGRSLNVFVCVVICVNFVLKRGPLDYTPIYTEQHPFVTILTLGTADVV